MIDIGNNLDGSVEKAVKASQNMGNAGLFRRTFMTLGDFTLGNAKKVDLTSAGDQEDDPTLQKYAAQISVLNDKQQEAVFGMTKFNAGQKKVIQSLVQQIAEGEKLSGVLTEQTLSQNGFSKAAVEGMLKVSGLQDAEKQYGLAITSDAIPAMEKWINENESLIDIEQLRKQGIITGTSGNYQFEESFKGVIANIEADSVATMALTDIQIAWNAVMQIGKQLLLSLGAAALAFVATEIVKYIANLKSHSEELVAEMEEAHEVANTTASDINNIKSKIDDLNNSIKNAGAEKIEDIVDPAERERLQAINDMLQAQLELKEKLQKDQYNANNTTTSAVVNDQTEDSIVNFHQSEDIDPTSGKMFTYSEADKVTKTESLNEHSDYLDQLVQKRREMAAAGEEETQAYKDNEAEIEKEKKKVGELSNAVSEQADKYETDADNFDQYKDEYVGCTDAIKAAAAAIKNANDGLDVDTTNLDVLKKKIQDIQEQIANGDGKAKGTKRNDYGYLNAVDTLKSSGVTTGEDILNLASNRSSQTDEQSKAIATLRKEAKDAKVSLAEYVSVLEQTGEVATKAATKTRGLSETMSLLDNMQSGYQTCAAAVDEYNKKGYVTMDTLQSLINLEPQYMSMLEMKNGKLKINGKTAQTLTDVYIELARAELLTDTITKIKETNSLEKAQSVLAEVKSVLGDAEKQFMSAQHESAVKAYETDGMAGYDAVMRAAKQEWDNYKLQDELLKKLGSRKPSDIWGKDDTSKSTKQATSAIDAWSTLSSAMKEYNEQGYITFQTLKSLTDLEDKYSSMLKKNDVTSQLEMRTDDFYELIKAELKEAQTKGDGASETQYNKILEWTNRHLDKQTMSYWDLVAAIEGYSAALSEAKEITDGFKDVWDNGKTVKQKTEKSRTGALDYEGTEAQSAALQSIKKYSQYDPDLINKAYNKDTGKIDLSGDVLKDAVVESLKQQAEAARSEGGAASEAIARSYEIAKENIENDVISVQDYFDGLGSTVEEFSSKIDEMQSAWTDLSDVTNEYNTYGGLSVDSIQKLLTMSPEYLQFLKMEGGQLVFNKEAMLAKTKADILAKAAELELKEETKDQAEILRALAASLDKGADSMEGMGKSAEKLKTLMSELNTVLNSFIGVFDDLNDKQSNDLKIQGEAWVDVIDKRIDALNEENDAQERAIELAKLQDEYERAKANKTVHVYGGKGQGFVWKADENAVREAGQNLSDKQREYKKKDEIDKLEKLKDKVQETNNLIGTSWDDYQKKLKYTAEFEAMTFEQMEGHYDGFKDSVLNNMQAIQGATNVKNVITDITNLISTLETLANILNILNGGTGDGGGVFGFINQIKNMFTGENGDFDLGGGFKKMFDGAAKVVSDGWNWITGKNRAGSAALKSDTTATLDILGNTIQVNTGSIQRISGGFFERLVGAAKDNLGSIGKFFSGA